MRTEEEIKATIKNIDDGLKNALQAPMLGRIIAFRSALKWVLNEQESQ